MAEANSLSTFVVWSGYGGYKCVLCTWASTATADTISFTGVATMNTIKAWFVHGNNNAANTSVTAASNQLTFGATSGGGSGYLFAIGF